MDRFQLIANDQLLQIDALYNLYAEHLEELHNIKLHNIKLHDIKLHDIDLRDAKSVSLRKSGQKNGKSYYYICDSQTGKRKYLGTDSSEKVRLMKEVRFCRELIKRAEKDKMLLRHLIDEYCPLDYDTVNGCLPRTYRGAELSFGNQIRTDKRAEEWKKRKEAIKSRVPIIYPEDLKHTAIDGTLVRSKSELTIANMLFTNNVPYIYECPYFFDSEILRFDFTALSTIDYETEVIVEHQGMMDLESYCDKYMHTLLTCLNNGLTPNEDIYFTFEDVAGNFDSRQIWDIIRTRLIQID